MDNPASPTRALACAIAAHRFGLAQPRCADVGDDPRGWLLSQLVAAPAQRGSGLLSGVEGVRSYAEFVRQQRQQRQLRPAGSAAAPPVAGPGPAGGDGMAPSPSVNTSPGGAMADGSTATGGAAAPGASIEQAFVTHFRQVTGSDLRARLSTAALSPQPLTERLALFWSNHFTVSVAKPSVRALAGAFEREAIRPHTGGSFETLLQAAVRHGAMLRYLDNEDSAGPDSALVRRLARRAAPGVPGNDAMAAAAPLQRGPRITGLNENLAREVLELHTLGVSGGGAAYGGWGRYTQADVTAFAAVLTGWRVPVGELLANPGEAATGSAAGVHPSASRFDPSWHQPGAKTVLGRRYAEGPQALAELLRDLAQHPDTARFVSYKLARHFIADEPPPALVAQLEQAWLASQGHLPTVMTALVQAPQAWLPLQAKLKTPEEFVISTVRLLGLGETAFERAPDGGIGQLGQRVLGAPSPAGWSDRAADWLGPDAVWKRVEWATRVADRAGRRVDARALAQDSLGPLLQPDTARQIERAADGPQALALLLLAPEFQRR
jgi:uncharacterized protein (DUF1800 family)